MITIITTTKNTTTFIAQTRMERELRSFDEVWSGDKYINKIAHLTDEFSTDALAECFQ